SGTARSGPGRRPAGLRGSGSHHDLGRAATRGPGGGGGGGTRSGFAADASGLWIGRPRRPPRAHLSDDGGVVGLRDTTGQASGELVARGDIRSGGRPRGV